VRQIPGSGRYKIHATYTEDTYCNYNTILNILSTEDYDPLFLLAVLNSSLMSWIFPKIANSVVSDNFPKLSVVDLENMPIPELNRGSSASERDFDTHALFNDKGNISEHSKKELHEILSELARNRIDQSEKKKVLNLSLLDHFGNYEEGQTLSEIGLTQPPRDSADSILQQTTEQRPNLRVGEATVERESDTTVEIRLTARYKPEDEDAHETDQWGYTETEPLPALRITDLTETEADLIAAFVPVAVEEAGGFADFRETATKTNSLVDRLRKLTLPRVRDVEAGLESYVETKRRAEDLEAKIERTDDLIDEIVYELYGLTEEEIAIVEEAVGD